jgi:hypothetical protein
MIEVIFLFLKVTAIFRLPLKGLIGFTMCLVVAREEVMPSNSKRNL